jgi:protein-disulfide isomerase
MSKRQSVRAERARRQRQQRLITILIIAGAALVIAAVLIIPSIQKANAPVGEIVKITPVAPFDAKFNAMGDPNAPVKIEEYADFQCPYCKEFSDNTLKQIEDTYVKTGKVYFVSRSMGNFVSNNIGGNNTESQDAAEAAYCAGDQNQYWQYHNMLFANWQGENAGSFSTKRLQAFAQELNLNMNDFNSCLSSHKYRDQVTQDYNAGTKAGVNATPSFIINGKLVVGALPFSDPSQSQDFKREIDAALAAKGVK